MNPRPCFPIFCFEPVRQAVQADKRFARKHARQGTPATPCLLHTTLFSSTSNIDRAGNVVNPHLPPTANCSLLFPCPLCHCCVRVFGLQAREKYKPNHFLSSKARRCVHFKAACSYRRASGLQERSKKKHAEEGNGALSSDAYLHTQIRWICYSTGVEAPGQNVVSKAELLESGWFQTAAPVTHRKPWSESLSFGSQSCCSSPWLQRCKSQFCRVVSCFPSLRP